MKPFFFLAAAALWGCAGSSDTADLPDETAASSTRGIEAPVPLDAESPVEYPPDLYQQGVGGTVLLRLFVTADGAVVPESTRVQESSGFPALDSAAIEAAPKLRYAPATRNGTPVAAPFTQPIVFRAPTSEIVP